MGNVFKSVAKFLDNALSGGEVDVIAMDASAATADRPLSNQADGEAGAGELVAGEQAALETTEEQAAEETTEEQAAEETTEEQAASGELNVAEEAAGDEAGVGANASAETASMPSVRQMLGEGQVAIDAVELEGLRADAAKWKENATELENLRTWKANGSKENVLQGAVDTADAVASKPKKVSAQTQAAIDLQEKMEAQRNK